MKEGGYIGDASEQIERHRNTRNAKSIPDLAHLSRRYFHFVQILHANVDLFRIRPWPLLRLHTEYSAQCG
jgi:hypothetical protein